MVQPEVRRASDPRIVRKLHFAIKKTCEQKQAPIFERVFRALSIDKVQVTRSRVELQLSNSIRDGLISENNSTSNRGKNGSNSGGGCSEVKTSYRVPTLENFYENYEDDGHDWYCWVCHREGEVYLCSTCPRVIHKKCAEVTQEELEDDFVCYCCKDLKSTKNYGKKELQELSTMLTYTVERMKSKCEELWKSPSEEEEPQFRLFVYNDTNLLDLEKKVQKREFNSLAKFHYEIEWLFHNAVIFYGGDHKITRLARMVVLDGQNELSQIDICSECYILSNERTKNWFSQPCKPPHRIVYAKLGSDPPWPAKVLRDNEEGTMTDVRFFGPPYQRAWVSVRHIWDLARKPANKKRSKALIQAEDELKLYSRLLAKLENGKEGNNDSDTEDYNATEEEVEDRDERASSSSQSKRKRNSKVKYDLSDEEEEEEDDDDDDDDDNNMDEDEEEILDYDSPIKRKKKKDKKMKSENDKTQKRGRPRKALHYGEPTGKKTKAEKRFRELQAAKLRELQEANKRESKKKMQKKNGKDVNGSLAKVDMNKNYDPDTSSDDESSDLQLAEQIKMTDDYKMIEKLQERLRSVEKQYDQMKNDCESAQADAESSRLDLAAERQKSKRLQEHIDRAQDICNQKMKTEILHKKQEEIDAAIEEERKRNELEFDVRLKEAIHEERSLSDLKVVEALEKERIQLESKIKQREQEEMQRNFERYKQETDIKHKRAIEETVHNLKIEADEMTKRAIQENLRRMQVETERVVANAKKKSWCSNCTKEAFYHCCWNTNYCSIDCQRVHWVTHRYQCTREMMSTCRSCQQRQNFTSNLPPPQGAPK